MTPVALAAGVAASLAVAGCAPRPEPPAETRPYSLAHPQVPPAASLAHLDQASTVGPRTEAALVFDQQVADALAAHDTAAIRALAAAGVDADVLAGEVSATECVGPRIDVLPYYPRGAHEPDGFYARHVLGFSAPGGSCDGAHELHLRYGWQRGELRLLEATRFGW